MRSKSSQWRWFGNATLFYLTAYLWVTACASLAQNAPEQLVPMLTIQNSRSNDLPNSVTFYVLGSGRHSLGIIDDHDSKRVQFDPAWLGADGCIVLGLHFVGSGDVVSPPVCPKRGESVDATIMEDVAESSIWAHR